MQYCKLDGRPIFEPGGPGAAIPDEQFGEPTPQTGSDSSLIILRIFVYTPCILVIICERGGSIGVPGVRLSVHETVGHACGLLHPGS